MSWNWSDSCRRSYWRWPLRRIRFRPVFSGLLWAQGLGILIEKPWKIYRIRHRTSEFMDDLDDLDAEKIKMGPLKSVLRITVKRYLKHFVAGKKTTWASLSHSIVLWLCWRYLHHDLPLPCGPLSCKLDCKKSSSCRNIDISTKKSTTPSASVVINPCNIPQVIYFPWWKLWYFLGM